MAHFRPAIRFGGKIEARLADPDPSPDTWLAADEEDSESVSWVVQEVLAGAEERAVHDPRCRSHRVDPKPHDIFFQTAVLAELSVESAGKPLELARDLLELRLLHRVRQPAEQDHRDSPYAALTSVDILKQSHTTDKLSLEDSSTLLSEARVIEQTSLECCRKILRGFIVSRSSRINMDIRSHHMLEDELAAPITLSFE